MLNKEKIKLSKNGKFDKFLKKTISVNAMSFWQYRATYLHTTSAMAHNS